jgi:hypothetical protein
MGALEVFTVPTDKQKKDGINVNVNKNTQMKLQNHVLVIITLANLLNLP